ESKADWLAEKISGLRIFEDENGKTNLSIHDVDGELLLVSQFSLYASCIKGRRPSFTDAAKPDEAERLYDYFVSKVKSFDFKKVTCGEFGADMEVEIINDGPLTFIIDA
ncbi:MAG: D-tyrosyl-tRNA(Tyr) deacylase, partial [Synergistaceae bacterium]|nr:D-tyrosyl-tRNA(Tyr) deacylase [Synergistaceae bacterium]